MSERKTTNDNLAACAINCSCSSQDANPRLSQSKLNPQTKPRRSARGITLLAVACLTSPCCVPLVAPVILGLLAGTPLAVWLGAHLSWFYGTLTVVSVISFLLAWRAFNRKASLSKSVLLEVIPLPTVRSTNQSQ